MYSASVHNENGFPLCHDGVAPSWCIQKGDMSDVRYRCDGFTDSTVYCLLWGEEAWVYNYCLWVRLPKGEELPLTTILTGCGAHSMVTVSCFIGAWSWTHIPSKKRIKNAWSFNCITFYAIITIRWQWWLWKLFYNYSNVFNAVVPPCLEACVRFWRGRQSVDVEYWKYMLCFVCLQLNTGQGNTSVAKSPWNFRCLQKVSFKN